MIFSFQAIDIDRSFWRHGKHWNSPMSNISVTGKTWWRARVECKRVESKRHGGLIGICLRNFKVSKPETFRWSSLVMKTQWQQQQLISTFYTKHFINVYLTYLGDKSEMVLIYWSPEPPPDLRLGYNLNQLPNTGILVPVEQVLQFTVGRVVMEASSR